MRDSSCPRDAPNKLHISLAETSAAAIRCFLDLVYTGQTLMPSERVRAECVEAFAMFGVTREDLGLTADDDNELPPQQRGTSMYWFMLLAHERTEY
jgi:hypothetical protein